MVNVFLNDEAYARLKAVKKEHQSFSDAVMENIEPNTGDFRRYLGAWKDVDVEKVKKKIRLERR